MSYFVKCLNKDSAGFEVYETDKQKKGHFTNSFKSTFSTKIRTSLSRDIIRIGEGIFLCDRAFTRSKNLGLKTRELEITIPVENIDLFESIKDKISNWAKFVTHDVWDIKFVKHEEIKEEQKDIKLDARQDNKVVSLFSDGLDSLCGAIYSLKKGENLVFVSHCPPGFKTVQKKVNELKQKMGLDDLITQIANFHFVISDRNPNNDKRNMFQERSRRSRPILYLSFAAAIAFDLGISTIRINENGYMAINLPITGFKKGVDLSRHAHPEAIKQFEDILNEINPNSIPIKIENPFFYYTKTQQLQILTGVSEFINGTKSCEYGGQQIATVISAMRKKGINTENVRECGLCIPCLVRRTAVTGNGFSENNNHYAFDIKDSSIYENQNIKSDLPLLNIIKDNALHLKEFCIGIKKISLKEFISTYLFELSLLYRSQEDLSENINSLYKMHINFAEEYLEFISK